MTLLTPLTLLDSQAWQYATVPLSLSAISTTSRTQLARTLNQSPEGAGAHDHGHGEEEDLGRSTPQLKIRPLLLPCTAALVRDTLFRPSLKVKQISLQMLRLTWQNC